MAKVLYDSDDKGNPTSVVIILDKNEIGTMIAVLSAGVLGKKFTKQSKAYKLAMDIEGKFPL